MKAKRILVVILLFAAIAAVALCIISTQSKIAAGEKFAYEMIELSNRLLSNTIASGCFSECFYSTKTSPLDTVKVYKNASAFNRWRSEYWDIPQTYPENWGQSMSQDRFNEGYIALVVAPSAMQDHNSMIAASCKYIDPNGNIFVELQQKKRNSCLGYRQDPSSVCEQVYVIIYLKESDIDEAETVSVGVRAAEGRADVG